MELRKSKKDDQMLKRRNIDVEDVTSPVKEDQPQSPVTMSLDEIVEGMKSSDKRTAFVSTQSARKMLSRERNPPIDVMIGHGIVPLCVQFLDNFNEPDLQFEAAWALTNIASGTTEQTQSVIKAHSVPKFVALLSSPATNVAEQAVWALGNIAGDGPDARDMVLNHDVVSGLLHLVHNDIPISFLRNVVWLMSNLCRNKNPPPSFDHIRPVLPALAKLLHHKDEQILSDTCWALSYVTDDENSKIQAVIDTGCLPRLVELLDVNDAAIITPALRSVGNIVTGSDHQTDAVIAAGGILKLSGLLRNPKPNIIKEAAWTVSNITAGNATQIQKVIESGVIKELTMVLEKGDFKAQKEAAWAITNLTQGGNTEQIIGVINQYNFMKPYCDLLDAKDPRTVKVVLTGLGNIFALAEKMNAVSELCMQVEQIGGLDKLEALQNHANEEIYKKAFALIDSYFTEDGENEQLAPETDENGALKFGTAQNANDVPAGGFNF